MQTPPNSEVIRIALDRTDGNELERFSHPFLAAKLGATFVPLGGVHDGGADGLIAEGLFEKEDNSSYFMQASIDQDPRTKIRGTVRRLVEFGREPKQLLYFTNRIIPNLDKVEEALSTDLDVVIRIRDGKYIAAHIPSETATVAAYYDHLHHQTTFLEGVGRGAVLSTSSHVRDPHVYTYLVGELNRGDSTSFADGVVDAMIVFALEGTDPATGLLMSESDIRTRIIEVLPAAEALLADRLRNRLEAISKKSNRRIRWHRPEDRWALPFEEREALQAASIEDEALRIMVLDEFAERFSALDMNCEKSTTELAQLTLDSIQLAFEQDGLRFSKFLEDGGPEESAPFVSDSLRATLDEAGLTGDARQNVAEAIRVVLREVFYSSTHNQRTLLQRISRAYGIVFALNGEPRVLKYFDDSLSSTWLYVGADVIISALSERYVASEDQHTRNLLRAASSAGARLRLAAPVLDEVLAHLRRSDREYLNYVEPIGGISSFEIARQVPKILVRAFLYTQILGSNPRPSSWEEYVNQFCDYRDLHTPQAVDNLRRYLVAEFKLDFEDWTQVKAVCEVERHEVLTGALLSTKASYALASNDAYIYALVTNRRSTRDEENRSLEFGYQTWWLSAGEGAAVRLMAKAEGRHDRILMRPGFLAKFIQLAPSAGVAREGLSSFLPSLLGIKLARRIREDDFHKMIDVVKEAETLEDGGRTAKIAAMVDRLKTTTRSTFDGRFRPDEAQDFLTIDETYSD